MLPPAVRSRLREPSAALCAAVLLLGACGKAKGGEAPAPHRAVCSGPGSLEVRNVTGGLVEVFAMRTGSQQYLGAVSPGTQSFLVADVSDPNVTYLARDPRDGGNVITVTWRARKTRASPGGIELTLRCGR